jgi:hypothetical protein
MKLFTLFVETAFASMLPEAKSATPLLKTA